MLYQGLLVGLGGFVGGLLRFLAISLLNRLADNVFPYGTLAVNILGCLFIGVFVGLSEKHQSINPEIRLFLTTGLCGGFTTFSSFAYENVILFKTEHYFLFALYAISSYVLGILAISLGLITTKI